VKEEGCKNTGVGGRETVGRQVRKKDFEGLGHWEKRSGRERKSYERKQDRMEEFLCEK